MAHPAANALGAARAGGDIGEIAEAALAGVFAEIDADAGGNSPFSAAIRAHGVAQRSFGIGYDEGFRAAMRLLGITAATCAAGCGREVDGDGYLHTPLRESFIAGGGGCQHDSRAWAEMKARLNDG